MHGEINRQLTPGILYTSYMYLWLIDQIAVYTGCPISKNA